MPVMHPKRSPTSTGDRELREGRMPSRKASCSVMGSHSLPPSSPMVSSANNPNKSEIPDRRKEMTATTVRGAKSGFQFLVNDGSRFKTEVAVETRFEWSVGTKGQRERPLLWTQAC